MASPPPNSSPTGLAALTQPKKRVSDLSLAPNGHATKRRKASNWSQQSAPLSAHPLRQTSFPLEPASPSAITRSPSVDAVSLVSASTAANGPPKKKRGRKPRNVALAEAAATATAVTAAAAAAAPPSADREKTPSLAGAKAGSTATGKDGAAGTGADGADDDDDDEEVNMAIVDTGARTQEQKQEELRLRAMLVEAFDSEQYGRYEVWRASRLSDAVVKRVVNTAVSQSVPPTVTLAIKSVTKLFAGHIIEMARRIQAEWIATGEDQADVPAPPARNGARGANPDAGTVETTPPDPRAPLRPDHLREAWRRYRATSEGSGVGTHAVWHQQQGNGVSRFATRMGKRIFR